MFICIFLSQWLRDRDLLIQKYRKKIPRKQILLAHAGEITGVLASLLCLLIFGSEKFIIPSMILILVILACTRKQVEPFTDDLNKAQTGGDQA